jgi:hypothetical protein
MLVRDLFPWETSTLRESYSVSDQHGNTHEWHEKGRKKWLLTLQPRDPGRIQIGDSYYVSNDRCPCALLRLDGRLEPVLSGWFELLNNYITTDQEIDPDPSNGRYEIKKVIGLCGLNVVIQHVWEPVSVAIIDPLELRSNAPELWADLIYALGQVRDALIAKGQPSWDVVVIEYFLSEGDDVKAPRSDQYHIELEKNQGEVEEPEEPEVHVIEPTPLEKLQTEFGKVLERVDQLSREIRRLSGEE